eukprot:783637-Rhodomonas_salina.4
MKRNGGRETVEKDSRTSRVCISKGRMVMRLPSRYNSRSEVCQRGKHLPDTAHNREKRNEKGKGKREKGKGEKGRGEKGKGKQEKSGDESRGCKVRKSSRRAP